VTLARTPKWVWYLCAAGTLAGMILFLFRDRSAEVSKPKSFVSIYGEPVTYPDEQVLWITGHTTSYVVIMPVPPSADAEQKTKQADELFSYYEGPHADDLGFKRVVIRPDTGTHPGEIDIFGFKFWLRVDVGYGPATEEELEDGIIYEKQSDGVWSRGGYKPDAPFHVQDVALPSGARFALTYSMEDNPSGWFVYECLSCRAPNGNVIIAENLYPLLQSVTKIADRDHLSKLSVAIFAAARKSTWQFPTILHVNMAQRAGQWIAPKLSSKQIETLLVQYGEKMRAKGAAFRHERL
jgi:hypothetical protein